MANKSIAARQVLSFSVDLAAVSLELGGQFGGFRRGDNNPPIGCPGMQMV